MILREASRNTMCKPMLTWATRSTVLAGRVQTLEHQNLSQVELMAVFVFGIQGNRHLL